MVYVEKAIQVMLAESDKRVVFEVHTQSLVYVWLHKTPILSNAPLLLERCDGVMMKRWKELSEALGERQAEIRRDFPSFQTLLSQINRVGRSYNVKSGVWIG